MKRAFKFTREPVGVRLRVWQERVLDGLVRSALVFHGILTVVTSLAARQQGPTWLVGVVIAREVALAAIALVRGHYLLRARAFVGLYVVYCVTAVHAHGPSGGLGTFVGVIGLAGVLLLGLRHALVALGITGVGLLVWWVTTSLGLLPRPPLAASDLGATGPSFRSLFGILTTMPVLMVALAYLIRKLVSTLEETESLLDDLRAEANARADEIERRTEVEKRLVDAKQMEAIGQLARGMAHDVNNNLQVVMNSASELLGTTSGGKEVGVLATSIIESVRSVSSLTQQLLTIGRRETTHRETIDPAALVRQLERMLRIAVRKGIDVRVDAEEGGPLVSVDPMQLQQVILNLVINARDAIAGEGSVCVRVEHGGAPPAYARATHPDAPPDAVRIHVEDTGSGMCPEVLSHLFTPFFTTKGVRGSGLGLAIARTFAEINDGRLGVTTEVGKGTCFTIELPRAPLTTDAPAVPATAPVPRPEKTILIVDDDADIRNAMVELLAEDGYAIVEASHAAEALVVAHDANVEIDLLCSDLVMSGTSGEVVVEAFQRLRPTTPVVVCSHYLREPEMEARLRRGSLRFLRKPFSATELRSTIRAALASRRSA